MKRIGIIGALKVEIKLLKEIMEDFDTYTYAGFEFFKGTIHNIDVVVTACSVGKVNAASCTQLLIDKFEVSEIIHTGIAGGLHADLKVCDIVIADNLTYHDVRKRQMEELYPFKTQFETCPMLKEAIIKAYELMDNPGFKYHTGRISTGDMFVENITLRDEIIREYASHCVEMEGAAIAHVAHMNNIPFIVIRSISDNADGSAVETYEQFEEKAATNSAQLVLNTLNVLNDSCS